MSNTNKTLSPFLQAALTLDTAFSELSRLSGKIQDMELKSDFDFEQMQKILTVFSQCGESVSAGVVALAQALNDARSLAEENAQRVTKRAEELGALQIERQKKMDKFRQLGEKVHALNVSLLDLKRPEGSTTTEEDRAKISMRLSEFELQLRPLIEEAQQLQKDAQTSRMKALEQGADSLRQSLLAVSQKLSGFQQTDLLQ